MFKIGIDIGYSTFKYIYLDKEDKVIKSGYKFHKGKIEEVYRSFINGIKEIVNEEEVLFGITGSHGSRIKNNTKYNVNNVVALVDGAVKRNSDVKSIIELGSQETKYVTNIDSTIKSNIKFFLNSSCASGTGAFLEEQATRLSINFEDISELVNNATSIPRIAGRCSVFSKTDMIHYQQEGYKVEDILLGLCYSLVRNYKANVVQKNKINTPIMLTGGVIYNAGVLKAIKDIFNLEDEDIIVDEYFNLISCFGACEIATKKNNIITISELEKIEGSKRNRKSIYEELNKFGYGDSKDKHICAVDKNIKEGYLGIDVGSTSTNFVVIDNDNNVIDYIYTKTKGKPKEVVLENLEIIKKRLGKDFVINGIGTTGSGRVLIGNLVNADFVVNEITAQAEGAISMDNSVDTIFEIGGQDSKYISIENRIVKEFEMNKICAAGTGAFIEEQVKKLGLTIEEFTDVALKGDNPSNLGDRCTVFIEGNIGKEITEGESIENISAGLAYSIVKNYLNRVVGNRKIGEKIFLQGGIAHNQAILNAFRALLNKEIIVPSFFSVSGALGTAVLTKEHIKNNANLNKEIAIDIEEKIEKKRTNITIGNIEKIDSNKKTVGIPRVLFLNKMYPLFKTIFVKLGYNVVISEPTNEGIVKLSQEYSFDETCFPVKLINGHVAWLLDKKVDYIFLPHLHTMKHAGSDVREDYACVYMQTSPKIIESVFNLKEKGVEIVAPTLSFNFGKKYMIETLLSIGKQLGKNKAETTAAVISGMNSFFKHEKDMEDEGKKIISSLKENEKAFVVISRAYNIVDPILNMGIEDRLKEMGYKVLQLSNLEANEVILKDEHKNMYWPFGQHILTGAQVVRNYKNIYPIYITNHGCGPDTILTHHFKKEMDGKPYLHIEVDEHSSKIGVITRVEAFVNSLNNYNNEMSINNSILKDKNSEEIVEKDNKVYIPNIYPYSEILKVFLEKQGKNVDILEAVNNNTIEEGKRFSVGKEYFSLIGSLAEVINKVKDSDEELTLYFPTTEGSETFGQYGNVIRNKALELGKKIKLESPFIEDFLDDKDFDIHFVKCIIAGDLINLLRENKREEYLELLISAIKEEMITDNFLISFVEKIKLELEDDKRRKLFVIAEALVLYKDYLNNFKFKELEDGFKVVKQPLSESLYMFWYDYANKRNKTNKKYIKKLTEIEKIIKLVDSSLNENSPYNTDLNELINELNDKLPIYAGGLGRYRLAKLLTYKNADGIILASSMYENTATILKIIRENYRENITVPILDLYFDSNISKNNNELLEAFINYL